MKQLASLILISVLSAFFLAGCSNKGQLLPILVLHGSNNDSCSGTPVFRYLNHCPSGTPISPENANERTHLVNQQGDSYCILAYAVSKNDAYAVSQLLSSGADYLKCALHDQDLYKSWINGSCRRNGATDVLSILSAFNIPPRKDLIFTAADIGCLPALKLLVDRGIDVNEPDVSGWRPLDHVVRSSVSDEKIEAARYLIQQGANPKLQASDGKTPLERARETFKDPRITNWPKMEAVLTQNN